MLTPNNFDEVNCNFFFSPKNFEEITLHLAYPYQQVCPAPRASLAEPHRGGE